MSDEDTFRDKRKHWKHLKNIYQRYINSPDDDSFHDILNEYRCPDISCRDCPFWNGNNTSNWAGRYDDYECVLVDSDMPETINHASMLLKVLELFEILKALHGEVDEVERYNG